MACDTVLGILLFDNLHPSPRHFLYSLESVRQRENPRKIGRTKDLEVKFLEIKELRPRSVLPGFLQIATCAYAIMRQVRGRAQGQVSQRGCGFLGINAGGSKPSHAGLRPRLLLAAKATVGPRPRMLTNTPSELGRSYAASEGSSPRPASRHMALSFC